MENVDFITVYIKILIVDFIFNGNQVFFNDIH